MTERKEMASNWTRGVLDCVVGKIYLLKWLPSIGTVVNIPAGICANTTKRCVDVALRMWLTGEHASSMLMIGLDDFAGIL